MNETNKGDWAVAVRDTSTGKGYFVHHANGELVEHVDEQTARKAFGLAIRAVEFELPVNVDETESIKASAVRLLRWSNDVKVQPIGGAEFTSSGWVVVQEHQGGVINRWESLRNNDALGGSAPYREDAFHPGVPCHPGAWGSPNACAMHWGLPLDDEHGMCAEGKRGAKYLGLICVPKSMQTKWNLRQTITCTELELVQAVAVLELVARDKTDNITDEQLERACQALESASTKAPK